MIQSFNNKTDKVGDDFKENICKESKLQVAAGIFSIYGFEALKAELKKIESLNFIFTDPTFIELDKKNREQRQFHLNSNTRQKSIGGSEFEINLKNELKGKAIAKECKKWIEGLEVIEACRLFDIDPQNIHVVVHPQSLIHSFIRTQDGSLYAQISHPDMKHPIFSALTWPQHRKSGLTPLEFKSFLTMTFAPPRWEDFPLLGLAFRCASLSKSYTIAYKRVTFQIYKSDS